MTANGSATMSQDAQLPEPGNTPPASCARVIDRTGQPPAASDAEWFRHRKESKPKCTGLAVLARRHCATWGICRNCRLCNHRLQRCGYFERAVLPGLDREDAESYGAALGVSLENTRHSRARVADRDIIPDAVELTHAA